MSIRTDGRIQKTTKPNCHARFGRFHCPANQVTACHMTKEPAMVRAMASGTASGSLERIRSARRVTDSCTRSAAA